MERQQQDWLRRAARRTANLPGTAERPDGSKVRVLVSNISYQGCHVWSECRFATGEAVASRVAKMGLIQGHVRWVNGDSAGIKFVTGDSAIDERRVRIGV
jgi:hypothetical protein